MRFIGNVANEQDALALSQLFSQQGIDFQCEVITNQDWGNDDYGTRTYNLWVIDEDFWDKAEEIFNSYMANTASQAASSTPKAVTGEPPPAQLNQPATPPPFSLPPLKAKRQKRNGSAFGIITLYLLFICGLLFFWSEMTTPQLPRTLPDTSTLPLMPLFSSPIKKQLLFDYPYAYQIVDKIGLIYGTEKALEPSELPSTGQYLVKEYENTPYWKGIYDMVVAYLRDKQNYQWNFTAPMFEKIQQGEVWRLITPILLHNDILHIFFNMFWLIVLGNQLENRIGRWRYILFIVIVGIFSNTAQYLMTGPNFIGISGVLCAMFAFIWVRQRRAPWEGYDLDRMTMGFITFFILGMAFLQLISFYVEIETGKSIAPGVANTAHLSGALAGLLLGQSNFFAWKEVK